MRRVWRIRRMLGKLSHVHAVVQPTRPAALAVAPAGGLYVADGDRVLERLRSGRFVVYAAGLRHVGGIAVHDGVLYVAESDRVVSISRSGVRTVFRIRGATAIAFDAAGRLVVASSELGEVVRRAVVLAGRPTGPQGIAPGSDDGANGLAYDSAGNLFLAGSNTKTLLMLDTRGRLRLPVGLAGFYPRGAGGVVTGPRGVVYAMNTQDVDELHPHGVRRVFTFANRTIDGIRGFLPDGIAVAPGGTIYVDTALGNGWTNRSAIVAIRNGVPRVLWRGPP